MTNNRWEDEGDCWIHEIYGSYRLVCRYMQYKCLSLKRSCRGIFAGSISLLSTSFCLGVALASALDSHDSYCPYLR